MSDTHVGDSTSDASGRLAVVATVQSEVEAAVLRSLLESADIPVSFRTAIAHSAHPFALGDEGALQIFVPSSLLDEAWAMIAHQQPDASPDSGEPGTPEDEPDEPAYSGGRSGG